MDSEEVCCPSRRDWCNVRAGTFVLCNQGIGMRVTTVTYETRLSQTLEKSINASRIADSVEKIQMVFTRWSPGAEVCNFLSDLIGNRDSETMKIAERAP